MTDTVHGAAPAAAARVSDAYRWTQLAIGVGPQHGQCRDLVESARATLIYGSVNGGEYAILLLEVGRS